MERNFSRRDFVKLAGAGAALSAAGCATTSTPPQPVGRVIVIGGGYGGATAARYLRQWSGGRIQVFLIERGDRFVSCPLSNLVLGGSRQIDQLTFGYDKLREAGVQVLRDEVTGIDFAKKRIQLTRIQDLQYDRLVVSPGIDFMFDQLPGLNNAEAQKVVLHAWKAGPDTVALRRQLEAMRDGGTYILSIPRAPYRCPPGPYERACQVASYFKAAKPKSRVLVLDANEQIVSKAGLFQAAWNDLYKGIIEYRPNQEVKDVDAKSMEVKTDFDGFKGDVLNVLPPMRAGNIARPLITANNRWCGVDWRSMESTAQPGVHVLGDATLSAPLMPKSASMANAHGKIAASAIVSAMLGEPPNETPIIGNTCYSYVSDREAMHVTSVHRYDATQKTLVTVPGSGGVSSQRSELEKAYADSWSRAIWSDALGVS